jgi:hypothetical protein
LGASFDRALFQASAARIGAQGREMAERPFVVCYRVSTRQQKRSALGLLAQQDSAHRDIKPNPGRLLVEVTEIESGRSRDRPQLKEALRLCRVYSAKLVPTIADW